MVSCSGLKLKHQIEYAKSAKEAIKEHAWISFSVERQPVLNDEPEQVTTTFVTYHFDKKHPFLSITDYDSLEIIKIDEDNAFIADHRNNKLACINKDEIKEDGFSSYLSILATTFEKIGTPYYSQVLGFGVRALNPPLMTNIKDTVVNGKQIRNFVGLSQMSHIFNTETQRHDIPLQYEYNTWINPDHHVDSVVSYNITDNVFRYKITFVVSDFSFEDKSSYLDSIFDFDNPRYEGYSRHNGFDYYKNSSNKKYNDSLADYPLVNLQGDTSSISQHEGWVLLNFWSLICPPCVKHLEAMGHEKDSLGYRLLEAHDIKILAINYESDNMELLEDMAQRTNSNDIIYSSKGMKSLINIPYLGYYYLLSPSREIVYESANIDDISELLKAKSEYEKNHPGEER